MRLWHPHRAFNLRLDRLLPHFCRSSNLIGKLIILYSLSKVELYFEEFAVLYILFGLLIPIVPAHDPSKAFFCTSNKMILHENFYSLLRKINGKQKSSNLFLDFQFLDFISLTFGDPLKIHNKIWIDIDGLDYCLLTRAGKAGYFISSKPIDAKFDIFNLNFQSTFHLYLFAILFDEQKVKVIVV